MIPNAIRRHANAIGVALAIAAGPGLALAQTPTPAQSPPVSSTPAHASESAPQTAPQTALGKASEARIEARIAQLHRQLKIDAAEEPQWDAFVAVMRENVRHLDDIYAQYGAAQSGTALDDMKAYAAVTQAHADNIAKLLPAFQTLYDGMSADQKKTADSVFHQYAREQAQRRPRG